MSSLRSPSRHISTCYASWTKGRILSQSYRGLNWSQVQYQSTRSTHGPTHKGHVEKANWDSTVDEAIKMVDPKGTTIVSQPPTTLLKAAASLASPLNAVTQEMTAISGNIRSLLGSGSPLLGSVARYYVQSEGKHIRPLIILLFSRALLKVPRDPERTDIKLPPGFGVDESVTPLDILRDMNPSRIISHIPNPFKVLDNWMKGSHGPSRPLKSKYSGLDHDDVKTSQLVYNKEVLETQKRLAEITELIHTASLMHDDVIDTAATRRGSPSGNQTFGNKLAILGGDFMLGRASVMLARLRNAEVIESMATVIANLIEGEFMQLRNTASESATTATEENFDYYLRKTYLKTASLISKSCRSTAVLAGVPKKYVDAAYEYGKNLGLAFQLVDDMLDFTQSEQELGKPSGGADLKLGLATGPVLYAWKKYPQLGPMIKRKFSEPGDVEAAREFVKQSDGVEQTRKLAHEYAIKASAALDILPESKEKQSLNNLCQSVLTRTK